jgi:hypothetical protein
MWLFGLYIARHLYQWQPIDEENDSILWKLNFIQMKILNGIAYKLIWIGFLELNWIQIPQCTYLRIVW